MIIFDLDGTLADCEHRRHFVDRFHPVNEKRRLSEIPLVSAPVPDPNQYVWKPDWNAFYEACDKDSLIRPAGDLFNCLWYDESNIEIWSGRSESVRKKTERWLLKNLNLGFDNLCLKMRPIRDLTPDDQLKEKWLDEALSHGKKIDYVFDDSEICCNMWNRRGIMCFLIKDTDGYSKNKITP